jgi:hypothetical protein
MRLRRIVISAFLLGLGVYILLPTPDEIIIHPTLGLLLSYVLNINIAFGVLLSVIIYRGIGSICILCAILLSGNLLINS